MIVDVEFTGTWLSSLLDPSDSIQLFKLAPREEDDAIEGQVVNYAGRAVAETTTKRTHSSPITFTRVSAGDAGKLRGWVLGAVPLLLRDGAGWWRTGVIFDLKLVDMYPGSTTVRLYRVPVTFNDIDYTAN